MCSNGVGGGSQQNIAREMQRAAQQQMQNMLNEMNNGRAKAPLSNDNNPLAPQNQSDTFSPAKGKTPNKVATPNAVDAKNPSSMLDKIKKAMPVDISSMIDAIKKAMPGAEPAPAQAPRGPAKVV